MAEAERERGSLSKRRVLLQSSENDQFELDDNALVCCSTVRNMLRGRNTFLNSLGGQFSYDGNYVLLKKEGRILASLLKDTEEEFVVALPDVKTATLQRVVEYCKCHNTKSANDYVKGLKQSVLCELASASYYLDIKPLVNLTSRAIATQISGKTSEEIRETFCNINYEQYAPVFASSLATRCRLQRKISGKKPKELLEDSRPADLKADDNRSVEDLLSFIDGASSSSSSSGAAVGGRTASANAAPLANGTTTTLLPAGPASASSRKKGKKKKSTPSKRGSDSPSDSRSPVLSRSASDMSLASSAAMPPGDLSPSPVAGASPAAAAAAALSGGCGSGEQLSRSVSLPDASLSSRAASTASEAQPLRAAQLSTSLSVVGNNDNNNNKTGAGGGAKTSSAAATAGGRGYAAVQHQHVPPRLSMSLDSTLPGTAATAARGGGSSEDDADDDADDFVFDHADEPDLDPEMEAAIQREVEEFRLRLELINSTSAGRMPLRQPSHPKNAAVGVH